jgi:hypothetical protein
VPTPNLSGTTGGFAPTALSSILPVGQTTGPTAQPTLPKGVNKPIFASLSFDLPRYIILFVEFQLLSFEPKKNFSDFFIYSAFCLLPSAISNLKSKIR